MFLKNFWEYVRVQSLYTDQFNTGSVTQKPCSIKASDGFNFSQMYIGQHQLRFQLRQMVTLLFLVNYIKG